MVVIALVATSVAVEPARAEGVPPAQDNVPCTWDARGNLLSDGVHTFAYDAANRLVAVSGGGIQAQYLYNGNGLLVRQVVNGQETTFAWDLAAALPQVLAPSDGAAYLYGLGLLGEERAGVWLHALPDGLGSIRQWADAAHQVVYAARHDPFGVVVEQQGVALAPWGFAGEYRGPAGLIYLRARWYDPATGRFLTRDPFPGLAALPQTQHPYVYVGNNPVNLTDPGGEIAPILIAAGAGMAIGAVVGGVSYVLAHPGGRPEDYLRSGGKPPPSIC